MDRPSTCGEGLAHHAALSAKLADVFAAAAETLEIHLSALDANDRDSRPEFDAYVALSIEYRELESRMRALALRMGGYRNLPMATHDMEVMTSTQARQALERLAAEKDALAVLLKRYVEEYQQMLRSR